MTSAEKTSMTDEQKLSESFKNAFGAAAADPESITFGSSSWDSIAHIALVSELESAFEIEFAPEDITDLTSYAKAKEVLGRHGLGFDR
jgi:acyl carrier protein